MTKKQPALTDPSMDANITKPKGSKVSSTTIAPVNKTYTITEVSRFKYTPFAWAQLSHHTARVIASLFPLPGDDAESPGRSMFEGLQVAFTEDHQFPEIPSSEILDSEDLLSLAYALTIISNLLQSQIRWDKVKEQLSDMEQIPPSITEYALALAQDCSQAKYCDVSVLTMELKPRSVTLPAEFFTVEEIEEWAAAAIDEYAVLTRRFLLSSFTAEILGGTRDTTRLAKLIEMGVRCTTYWRGVRSSLFARLMPEGSEEKMLIINPLAKTYLEDVRSLAGISGTTATIGPRVFDDVSSFIRHEGFYAMKASFMSTTDVETLLVRVTPTACEMTLQRVPNVRHARSTHHSSKASLSNVNRMAVIKYLLDQIIEHRPSLVALNPEGAAFMADFWDQIPRVPTPSRVDLGLLSFESETKVTGLEQLCVLSHPEYIDYTPIAPCYSYQPIVGKHNAYDRIKPFSTTATMGLGLHWSGSDMPDKVLQSLSPLLMALRAAMTEPYELGIFLAAISGFALLKTKTIRPVLNSLLTRDPHADVVHDATYSKIVKRAVAAGDDVTLLTQRWPALVERLGRDDELLDPGIPGPWGLPAAWWSEHLDLTRTIRVGSLEFVVPRVVVIWPEGWSDMELLHCMPIDRCAVWFKVPTYAEGAVKDNLLEKYTYDEFVQRVMSIPVMYAANHPIAETLKGEDGDIVRPPYKVDVARDDIMAVGSHPKKSFVVVATEESQLRLAERRLWTAGFYASHETVPNSVPPELQMGLAETVPISGEVTLLTPLDGVFTECGPGLQPAVSPLKLPPDQIGTDILTASKQVYYPCDTMVFSAWREAPDLGFEPIKMGVTLEEVWASKGQAGSAGRKGGDSNAPSKSTAEKKSTAEVKYETTATPNEDKDKGAGVVMAGAESVNDQDPAKDKDKDKDKSKGKEPTELKDFIS